MTTVRNFRLLVCLIAVTLFSFACDGTAPPAQGDIDSAELNQRIEAGTSPLILDVRSGEEYSSAHLPGAINIPHTDITSRLGELPQDKDTEIVVHCQSGRRAAMAETSLEEAGYKHIRHLEGDYAGWQTAGLPLERPDTAD